MAGLAEPKRLVHQASPVVIGLLRVLVVGILVLPVVWTLGMTWMPALFLPKSAEAWRTAGFNAPLKAFFQAIPAGRMLVNSLVVSLLAAVLSTIIASITGFAMARSPSSQQKLWLGLALAALVIPATALTPGRFLVFRALGWSNSPSLLGVSALLGGSPFFILIAYRAYHRIHPDIYDSSLLDGAGLLQTWLFVGVPIARASILVILVLNFSLFWGDLDTPLFYLQNDRWITLPVGLELLAQTSRTDWQLLLAGAVVAMIPPFLLLLIALRMFQKGKENR